MGVAGREPADEEADFDVLWAFGRSRKRNNRHQHG